MKKKNVLHWFKRVIYWLCGLVNRHKNPDTDSVNNCPCPKSKIK